MVQPLPLPSGSSLLTSRDEAKLPILEAIYPYFFLILISEAVKDCFLFPQIWVPGSLEVLEHREGLLAPYCTLTLMKKKKEAV